MKYSAIVLDQKSHDKLIQFLLDYYPTIYSDSDWEKISHHMTINLGELPPERKEQLGMKVDLLVSHVGQLDNVIAVRVNGYPSNNKTPHVTLAVNRKLGGKPVMSNDIKYWQKLSMSFYIHGKVQEL